jgi:hypothetical protein
MTTEPYEAPDFQIPNGRSASQPATENLKFERADWTSFRTIEGLQQKAGVVQSKLRRLVLKELANNALDTGARVRIGQLPDGGYFIEDDGSGIEGQPEEIARLFSIARPMISTKLLRLPTRGALGNGLRVVTGAVLASEGSLVVTTRNRRIELRPERDGSTTVVTVTPVDFPVGTRVEIGCGPAIPADANALQWANVALQMTGGQSYEGKSSPWWYDAPQFHELLGGAAPCTNWWHASMAAPAGRLARSLPRPGWPVDRRRQTAGQDSLRGRGLGRRDHGTAVAMALLIRPGVRRGDFDRQFWPAKRLDSIYPTG